VIKWILLAGGAYLLLRGDTGPKHIIAVGDSITAGPYPKHLVRKLPKHRVEIMGYGGKGAKYIHDKVISEVISKKPTDVVLLIGVNDIASGRGTTHTTEYIDKIYRLLDANGIRVTAVPILPWGARSNPLSRDGTTEQVNKFVSEHPIPKSVVDISPLGDRKVMHPQYTNDGIHPNSVGAEILSDLVVDALL